MGQAVGPRFWVETVTASVTALLALVTALWPRWIELVFRVDPDHGSGTVEWAIVAILALLAALCAGLARREWRVVSATS